MALRNPDPADRPWRPHGLGADYDPFGQAQVRVAEIAQPWRLPGQYADDEFSLGLHYSRFRYYDPVVGRYISRDPIGVAGGLNLNCYVGNDPINRAGPLGLFWGTVGLVLAAVAVVVLAPDGLKPSSPPAKRGTREWFHDGSDPRWRPVIRLGHGRSPDAGHRDPARKRV